MYISWGSLPLLYISYFLDSSVFVAIYILGNLHFVLSQCREGDITIWNLETHQKEGSLSLNSPGFCRLSALGPSSTASEAQPPDSTSCFAVSDARYGKVSFD